MDSPAASPPGDSGARERWYAGGLRFACTQCGNCCRNHGDYAFVYLAEADVRAIAEHLGLARGEFLERHCERSDGWITLRMDAPACPFLDSQQRCSIYAVRPMQCRTWPFWTENLERAVWEGPVRSCCPGIGQGELVPATEIEARAARNDAWYGA